MLLRVSIYKDRGSDCSNGGLSHYHDEVFLATDPENDPLTGQSLPVVKLVKRQLFGSEYVHAEPVERPPKGRSGYMAGGCFISTCDSRFPCRYPVSLHDRTE